MIDARQPGFYDRAWIESPSIEPATGFIASPV